ncbi:integrase core domain-containing protein [Psychrobacter sp. PSP]|nr:integrase core domain-containing protein [Psychrobacter sp. PSP]
MSKRMTETQIVSILKEAEADWIKVYNNERPHDSLNDMTPAEYRQVA